MKNGKKPYLGGIQEFGVAAYVKDLKAGKLDPRAKWADLLITTLSQKGTRFTGLENVQ